MVEKIKKCIVCGNENFDPVFSAQRVPMVPNAPLSKSELFHEKTVDLEFRACQNCSLITNKAFDRNDIEKIYNENYSSAMPRSDGSIERFKKIAENAIGKNAISEKTVVEVGASDFTFSEILIDNGAAEVLAFEPANNFKTNKPGIRHIQKFFSSKGISGVADLVVVRHVLEHSCEPVSMIIEISKTLKKNGKLYIELPDVLDILNKQRFYDFFYEHVSYFNQQLLSEMLRLLGFEILSVTKISGGQHIGMLCEKKANAQEPKKFPKADIKVDESKMKKNMNMFLGKLKEIILSYDSVAIYGAGNHGLIVTSFLDLEKDDISCFFDLNEFKEGRYSPKTHIVIKKPSVSEVSKHDAIIIIAPLHQKDIENNLRRLYQFNGDIWLTHPKIEKSEK